MEESAQAQDERQSIEAFINWHNKRFKTQLRFQRVEEVFSEIGNSTRWDYVIRNAESTIWHAVEIKKLIKPEAIIRLTQWNKFLRGIANRLGNQLQGEFLIYGAPQLRLERQRKNELKRILSELILQNATSLDSREMVDLGPQILLRFSEWPSTPHLNISLSSRIEHRINVDSCFTLHKISNVGASLELGFAQSGVFHLDQAFVEALNSLFSNGEIGQANTQLQVAKEKGATSTILVLDSHLPSWYPNHIRQVLADNMNLSKHADIDRIYLVKASENRVSKLWGKNLNPSIPFSDSG